MSWVPEQRVPRREPPQQIAPTTPLPAGRRVAVRLGSLLFRALGATWRIRVHGRQWLLDRPPAASPVVFTLWHGQMLPILYAHRQPTGVMISEHKDGEIIAQIVGSLGFFGVRGSSSRGGIRALLGAVQALNGGANMAITPDGPRGPRHTFAQGALILAQRAGVPIVPIVASVDRKWVLGSWDGFEIPKPFARVTILYAPPQPVVGNSARDGAARTDEFAAHMMDAVRRVEQLATTS